MLYYIISYYTYISFLWQPSFFTPLNFTSHAVWAYVVFPWSLQRYLVS
jgi:hypothetical protein